MIFADHYLDWNQKRIKGIIDFYGHKFMFYKKILDLGCGHADISGVLHRLGADITAVDVRQEHLKIAVKKYPGIKTIKSDLDSEWLFSGKLFDLVLDLDLICHLNNYEEHLRLVCASTNHLVIETSVCDSDDPYKSVILSENKSVYDLSINGVSCRPSSAAIERVLTECGMNFRRQDTPRYNSGNYIYNWEPANNDGCDINKRRLWFAVKSNNPIQFAPVINTPSKISNISQPPQQLQNNPTLLIRAKPLYLSSKDNPTTNKTEEKQFLPLKIAVVISGHMRTFERTFNSFNHNILGPYHNNVDTFIHTWETLGFGTGGKGYFDRVIANVKTESKLKEINRIYNPKSLIIDNYNEKFSIIKDLDAQVKVSQQDKSGFLDGSLLSYGSMLFSWKQVRDMLSKYEQENDIKYDIVIKLRSDLVFTGKFNIQKALDKLCVPNIGQYYQNAMNDQFAIGTPKDIKIYLSLYDHIVDYVNNKVTDILRPEPLLKYHLIHNGVKISEENMPYYILRANNEVYHLHTVRQKM